MSGSLANEAVYVPATANNVTHYAWTETQTGIEATGPDPVIDALESVVVDLSTGKTRCDEAKESGLMNKLVYKAGGY